MNALLGLCFLALFWHANADCRLDAGDIASTNRIFAFRDAQQYQPFRLDVVPSQQTLDMICKDGDVVQTTCQLNGKLSPALPLSKCKKPVKPTVEVIDDAICPFTMYRVGYKLNDKEFLELYRSCFDVPNQAAHFVIHATYPSSLTSRPNQGFTTDGVITGAMAASYQAKRIFASFEKLLGAKQTYVKSKRDQVFDRGHLAPSADFGFDEYMRQSFKYLNVVPQFRTINRSNWKSIENWIRRQLTDGNSTTMQLCTGALGVLQLPHSQTGQLVSMNLRPPQGTPVPEWMFKIANDGEGTRVAFITYNNVFDTKMPEPNCRKVACPATIDLQEDKDAGLTVCCDPDDLISKNVPTLKGVC